MREILFRGKRVDNGEWVYGLPRYTEYTIDVKIGAIEDEHGNVYENIKPESIGQYTGLLDKIGKKIFEGDLCRCEFGITGIFKKAIVYYENACFYVDDKDPSGNLTLSYFHKNSKEIEVIGNIHE